MSFGLHNTNRKMEPEMRRLHSWHDGICDFLIVNQPQRKSLIVAPNVLSYEIVVYDKANSLNASMCQTMILLNVVSIYN